MKSSEFIQRPGATGGQSPFTHITLDITVPPDLRDNFPTDGILRLFKGLDDPDCCRKACTRLVRKIIENYRLPYITITPVFSVCETHGYLDGEQSQCPSCGREALVWRRIASLTPFTFQDYPGHTARILWFSGCNLACAYCHNPELVKGQLQRQPFERIERFLGSRRGRLDDVVLSGGKCTLSPAFPERHVSDDFDCRL